MAKAKKTVISCDHPDCAKIAIVEQKMTELPEWIYGTAVDTGDGHIVNWYACCEGHVGPAVLDAFKKVRDADR